MWRAARRRRRRSRVLWDGPCHLGMGGGGGNPCQRRHRTAISRWMGRRDVREGSGAKVSRRVMLGQGHAVDLGWREREAYFGFKLFLVVLIMSTYFFMKVYIACMLIYVYNMLKKHIRFTISTRNMLISCMSFTSDVTDKFSDAMCLRMS